MKDLVTYHANTFNRVYLLKNLLTSFVECNVRENFEWTITDYGSTDGTRDFLSDFSSKNKWLNVVFLDQGRYFDALDKRNISPQNKKQIIATIFGKSINVARSVSNGEYFIHIADDHQFFRKSDWVQEMIDIENHRKNKIGKKDISSILYRGLSLGRVFKANNETDEEEVTDTGVQYFVAKHKHYDDYHMMSREMYEKVGLYFEIEKEKDKDVLSAWRKGEYSRDHYTNYLDRTKALGLKKVFMKYPCVVDFPNGSHTSLNVSRDGLIVPVIDNKTFVDTFKDLDRQVSSDEIFQIS